MWEAIHVPYGEIVLDPSLWWRFLRGCTSHICCSGRGKASRQFWLAGPEVVRASVCSPGAGEEWVSSLSCTDCM